jgi:hypothetical protein
VPIAASVPQRVREADPPSRSDEGFDRTLVTRRSRAAQQGVQTSAYYPGWEDKLINGGATRLPVLRVEFDDPERTLLYIDPHSGAPAGAYDASGRRLRGLYGTRPLWDVLVLAFMLGGFAMSVTGTWIGWKWLKRKARKPRSQRKAQLQPAE